MVFPFLNAVTASQRNWKTALPCSFLSVRRNFQLPTIVIQVIPQLDVRESCQAPPQNSVVWQARGGGSLSSPCPGLSKPYPVRGASRIPTTPSRNGRAPFPLLWICQFSEASRLRKRPGYSPPRSALHPRRHRQARVFLDLALAVNRVPWFGRFGLTMPQGGSPKPILVCLGSTPLQLMVCPQRPNYDSQKQ